MFTIRPYYSLNHDTIKWNFNYGIRMTWINVTTDGIIIKYQTINRLVLWFMVADQ